MIKDEVKDEIVNSFCEIIDGEKWFIELSMLMIMATLTELIKGV